MRKIRLSESQLQRVVRMTIKSMLNEKVMRKSEINSKKIKSIDFEIKGNDENELMRETISDHDISKEYLNGNLSVQQIVANLFDNKKALFDTIMANNEVSYAIITISFCDKKIKTRYPFYYNATSGEKYEFKVVFF